MMVQLDILTAQSVPADGSLRRVELGELPLYACAPQRAAVVGLLPRPELDGALLAALRDDVFGDSLVPLLAGPAGSGKTCLAKMAAASLGLGFYRVQASSSLSGEDLFCVARILPDGSISYVLQGVATAVTFGGLVLIDDCEKMFAQTLSVLLPLMDGDDRVLSLLTGSYLTVHQNFRLVLACNDPVQLPPWIRNRTVLLNVPYPLADQTIAMACATLPGTECFRALFLEAWQRRGASAPFSPRDAVNVLRYAGKLQAGEPPLSPDAAINLAITAVCGG